MQVKRNEIEFKKYEKKGAYHWGDICRHPKFRNAFVLGRYQNMLQLLQQTFPNGAVTRKRVLDVGCGDGALTYLIAREGFTVSGVDPSELAIRLAKEQITPLEIEIDFRIAPAQQIPWPDGSFDAVISSDVIEHVSQPRAMLEEIRRVLVPGGYAVISTPIRYKEFFAPEHVIEWFPQEYETLIREYFPESRFWKSHPIFLEELFGISKKARLMINLISLHRNPFSGFSEKFKYYSLQYSVSKNTE
ncbi:MAG: class I SAM-dependent methyltransferase [Magnetococcus sp. YQC-9]